MKFELNLDGIDPRAKAIPELHEFLEDFLKNRRSDLEQLKSALAASDFSALKRIGHTLKGMCAPYGVPEMGLLGARLEEVAESRNETECAELVEIFSRAVDKAASRLSDPS